MKQPPSGDRVGGHAVAISSRRPDVHSYLAANSRTPRRSMANTGVRFGTRESSISSERRLSRISQRPARRATSTARASTGSAQISVLAKLDRVRGRGKDALRFVSLKSIQPRCFASSASTAAPRLPPKAQRLFSRTQKVCIANVTFRMQRPTPRRQTSGRRDRPAV